MGLPRTWRVYHTDDREIKAERLKQRFAAISRRAFCKGKRRRLCIELAAAVLAGLAFVAIWTVFDANKSWSVSQSVRHLAASPNCAAARAVGLAPARSGSPGYWPSHDADNDGWACEPWSGGGRHYLRHFP